MATVSDSHTVFKQELTIEEATISSDSDHFQKQRLRREDAAAVLLLNTDTNNLILTRQFRYPIHDKAEAPILEIIAGRVGKDETPLQTALRETLEETGYRIRNEHIQFLLSCFSTPGYSSECFHIYYATVTDADKMEEGGGLKEEHESIECVEIDASEFITLVKEAKLRDAKTYIAGLYFANYI